MQPLPPRPRRSKRGPLLLVMLLVTALLVGLGGWYFGVARYTTTPGVINMTRAAAKVEVVRSGLAFDVTGTGYSETVAKGSVLRTDPAPGSRISKDGTVQAVISLGPERHAVPTVDGRTLDDAQAMLQESHLSFGRAIEKYSDTVKKGRVIKASPGVGTDLRRDAAVDLTVSKGQKPIEVPDFTGKAADDAEKALDDLGLEVDSTSTFDDDVAKGTVIAQDPSDGTLFKGDTVELTVSKGPELVEVPRVVAMGQGAAAKRLEEAGFTVSVPELRHLPGAALRAALRPLRGLDGAQGQHDHAVPRLAHPPHPPLDAHASHPSLSMTSGVEIVRGRACPPSCAPWSGRPGAPSPRASPWAGWSPPASRWTAPASAPYDGASRRTRCNRSRPRSPPSPRSTGPARGGPDTRAGG